MIYKIFKKTKKATVIILAAAIILMQITPVFAEDVPLAPTAPTAPSAPTETLPVAPTAPTAPSVADAINNSQIDPTPTPSQTQTNQETDTNTPLALNNSIPTDPGTTNLQGTISGGNVGDTTISTENAVTDGNVTTGINNNLIGLDGGLTSGATVSNTGNGTGSTNTGSATVLGDNSTTQTNSASVGNNLNQTTTTGQNASSDNVGNTTITSGDANTVGNVITAANTNMAGVSMSEFNVIDNQNGDLILNFADNCVSGCGSGMTGVSNIGNGSSSTNTGAIDQTLDNSTFQSNVGNISNDITFAANSGENIARNNTGGDTTIQTGDANVDANVLNFLNNNIAGNVVLGVVNIFGNLIGDIIFPSDQLNSCPSCGAGLTTASNIGNGSDSVNNSTINQTTNDSTFQTNDATIQNNLIFSTNTGVNDASSNTGGNTNLSTGTSTIDAKTLNVANSNVDGGNWWLVLVNKAGQWIGQILGAPDGSTFAGSQGTQFTVGANGEVTALNSGNGSNSTNTSTVNQTTNNTTSQTNTGTVTNNINLSANTGRNFATDNTGGNTTVGTGNAKIMANIVNFVNNNIAKGGKLFVTVVNVFGSWTGDFVAPGQEKRAKDNQNQGANDSSTSNNSNNNSSSNNSQTTTTTTLTTNSASSSNVGVIGGVTNTFRGIFGSSINNNQTPPMVLGASKNQTKNDLVKPAIAKKLVINLAWMLVILPGLLLAYSLIRFSKKINAMQRISKGVITHLL